MNKEEEFLKIINSTLEDNSYLGDDCAYLAEENLCVSTDALVEDVHFSTKYMNPSQIARKALLVNISDAIASGAKLKYITISLCGKLTNKFVEEFYKEVDKMAKTFDFKVIGGDLTKAEKIFISITVFASTKNRNISSRANAKVGYVVATVGEFGSSIKGLEELQQGKKESYFIEKHFNPILYPVVADKISKTKGKYALMDSSDGLVDCLFQISKRSKVKIEIEYDKIIHKTQNKDYVLFGGEDYCLVGCFDFNEIKDIKELNVIGKVSGGFGVYMDGKELEYGGFNHFE